MESLQFCCAPGKCYALPLGVGLARMVPADIRVDTIDLLQKSSKYELSSRLFGRLRIFHKIVTPVADGRLPCRMKSIASRPKIFWTSENLFGRFEIPR